MNVDDRAIVAFTQRLASPDIASISFSMISKSSSLIVGNNNNIIPIVESKINSAKELFDKTPSKNIVNLYRYKNKDMFYVFQNTILDERLNVMLTVQTHGSNYVIEVSNSIMKDTKRWIYFVIRNIIVPACVSFISENNLLVNIVRRCTNWTFGPIKFCNIDSNRINKLNELNGINTI